MSGGCEDRANAGYITEAEGEAMNPAKGDVAQEEIVDVPRMIEVLRAYKAIDPQPDIQDWDCGTAADMLESQAARIGELEAAAIATRAENAKLRAETVRLATSCGEYIEDCCELTTENAALAARLEVAESAIKAAIKTMGRHEPSA